MNIIFTVRKFLSSKTVHNLSVRHKSAEIKDFRYMLSKSKNVVIVTGYGLSTESGLSTFSGPGHVWRNFSALALAHPHAFCQCPALFWEYYNYRRELAAKAHPNMVCR